MDKVINIEEALKRGVGKRECKTSGGIGVLQKS